MPKALPSFNFDAKIENIANVPLVLFFAVFLVFSSSFSWAETAPSRKSATVSAAIPVQMPANGVTLAGPLAGKKVYILTPDVNIPGCWVDSPHWTGNELYYALTSLDFTLALSGGGLVYNPDCRLPARQMDGDFDIYSAIPNTGTWKISNININSLEHDAGMSLSANTMAYTVYYSAPKSWDIYMASKKVGTRGYYWLPPLPFQHNSKCKEDNPDIYAYGRKIIFESNRADPGGSTCNEEENMKLWYSEKTSLRAPWSVPELLPGVPNEGQKNTQPWVDEENGFLYWTDDKGCTCIRRIPFDGKTPYGEAENIVVPNTGALLNGTADNQVIFAGEYSHAGNYAFFACAVAHDGGPFLGRWSLSPNICVVPLSEPNPPIN